VKNPSIQLCNLTCTERNANQIADLVCHRRKEIKTKLYGNEVGK